MFQITPELEEKVIDLIHQGKNIEAVKLVKDNTNLDLREAKKLVDSIAAILKRPSPIHSDLHNEVVELIQQNKLLQAVKLIVENTDLGLKKSKEYVDFINLQPKNEPAVSSELHNKAVELVKQNEVLEAVKLISSKTSLHLKEAKEYVDMLRAKL